MHNDSVWCHPLTQIGAIRFWRYGVQPMWRKAPKKMLFLPSQRLALRMSNTNSLLQTVKCPQFPKRWIFNLHSHLYLDTFLGCKSEIHGDSDRDVPVAVVLEWHFCSCLRFPRRSLLNTGSTNSTHLPGSQLGKVAKKEKKKWNHVSTRTSSQARRCASWKANKLTSSQIDKVTNLQTIRLTDEKRTGKEDDKMINLWEWSKVYESGGYGGYHGYHDLNGLHGLHDYMITWITWLPWLPWLHDYMLTCWHDYMMTCCTCWHDDMMSFV